MHGCARAHWLSSLQPGGAGSHPCLSWLRVLIVFHVPWTLFLEVAAEHGLEPGAALFTGLLQAGPAAGEGHAGARAICQSCPSAGRGGGGPGPVRPSCTCERPGRCGAGQPGPPALGLERGRTGSHRSGPSRGLSGLQDCADRRRAPGTPPAPPCPDEHLPGSSSHAGRRAASKQVGGRVGRGRAHLSWAQAPTAAGGEPAAPTPASSPPRPPASRRQTLRNSLPHLCSPAAAGPNTQPEGDTCPRTRDT